MNRKRIRARMAVPSIWHGLRLFGKTYGYSQQLVFVKVVEDCKQGVPHYLKGTRWEAWFNHSIENNTPGCVLSDDRIAEIAEEHGLCTMIDGEPLWFDGNPTRFVRAIIAAHEGFK